MPQIFRFLVNNTILLYLQWVGEIRNMIKDLFFSRCDDGIMVRWEKKKAFKDTILQYDRNYGQNLLQNNQRGTVGRDTYE